MTDTISPRRSKLLRMLDDFFECKKDYLKKASASNQNHLRFAVDQIEKHFDVVIPANRPMQDPAEIIQLRGVCMNLSIALAKRCLKEANETAEPGHWPGGQSWDDLVGTSQSIFRRRAYTEAGFDEHKVVDLLFDRNGLPKDFDSTGLALSTPADG